MADFVSASDLMHSSYRQLLGRLGEDLVCRYAQQSGYEVVARNWRAGRLGELDIVLRLQESHELYGTLEWVFVEVKTRQMPYQMMRSPKKQSPQWQEDALELSLGTLTPAKRDRWIQVAQAFLQEQAADKAADETQAYRFDWVVVLLSDELASSPGPEGSITQEDCRIVHYPGCID